MPRLLAILTLAVLVPSVAAAESPAGAVTHHVAKKVRIRSYDPIHHDLVVAIDSTDVVLHTDTATVHGQLAPGRMIDVSWDDGTYAATQIIVRSDRPRAWSRP